MNKKPTKRSSSSLVKETTTAQTARQTANNKNNSAKSIYEFLEDHFASKRSGYLIFLVLLTGGLSFACFDNKISTANDDALYIEAGASYAKHFFSYFYLANAPLYPMVLGLLIKVIGVRLFLLKLFSVICFCLAILFIFKAFEKRIPYLLLIPSLLLTAVNFPYLMYASLTYTETFSLMIFGICFLFMFPILDQLQDEQRTLKENILPIVLTGLLVFVMMITRNVALAAIGVVMLFLLYRGRYLAAIGSVFSFGVFYLSYKTLLKYIWKIDGSQFASQGKLMFQKDAYNPQLGNETLWGFVMRFWENCQIYISSRLYYVLGMREEMTPNILSLTLFSIALILWSLVLMHKKKQYYLLFTTLFFCVLLGTTFITLHTSWGQTRLIMIFLPFILFSVFFIFYYYGTQFTFLQVIYPFVFFILFFTSVSVTLREAKNRLPVFIENITGDPTYGYTPDWQNYIKMSKWCAENLPNETIAVRKAPMSFIFSNGKEFYPIYSTPTENADSLLIPLRANKVDYIMLPELRLDPSRYLENQFIGTMHRYAGYIAQQYGDGAFTFIHREGELEKSMLYKINYTYIDSVKSTRVKQQVIKQ